MLCGVESYRILKHNVWGTAFWWLTGVNMSKMLHRWLEARATHPWFPILLGNSKVAFSGPRLCSRADNPLPRSSNTSYLHSQSVSHIRIQVSSLSSSHFLYGPHTTSAPHSWRRVTENSLRTTTSNCWPFEPASSEDSYSIDVFVRRAQKVTAAALLTPSSNLRHWKEENSHGFAEAIISACLNCDQKFWRFCSICT
jgi:hypothetical protein